MSDLVMPSKFEAFNFEASPTAIESDSFVQIRKLTQLDHFSLDQQQVVMRIVHSVGLPEIAKEVRFSDKACEKGREALKNNMPILCDAEMVKQGVTKRMIKKAPLCYLNHISVPSLAKKSGETRSMAALQLWADQLENSVVIIGNAPTALFRLLQMIKDGEKKPALIIGMPVGFIGAAESKQALWDFHKELDVECITLLGRQGGSAVSAATCNALLRCNLGEYY